MNKLFQPALIVLCCLVVLGGCTHMQPPEPRSDHYYCMPDSAIKHRGDAAKHGRLARPVTKTGTCRHQ